MTEDHEPRVKSMRLNFSKDQRWTFKSLHALQVSFDDAESSEVFSQREDAASRLNESIRVPLISEKRNLNNVTGLASCIGVIRETSLEFTDCSRLVKLQFIPTDPNTFEFG